MDIQDATTYDGADVIVSWEKQMERIVASESLKHFLRSPSLHPYLSPFLSFFPSFLPPSLFLFFLPSSHLSVTKSLSLCVLVPSQNNLGKNCPKNRSSVTSLLPPWNERGIGANGDLVRRTHWFQLQC